jgi:colanic acid biosynthesis glycosyl transferase WcaI
LIHLASFALSSLPVLLAQRKWRPDVVLTVAPAFFCAPGALLLGKLCGEATTTWLHIQDFELDAAFELGMLKGKWIRKLAENWERKTLQGFSKISTISEAMRQRAIGKGVENKRTCLLPNWVDLKEIQPQGLKQRASNPYRSELSINNSAIVLLYSGSMNNKQGLDLLTKVIHILIGDQDLVWLLAGEGPTKAKLKKSVEGLRNVKVLPLQPVTSINEWLNIADIHLLPQKEDAADLVMPSKLLGILASGRPLVASSPADSELGKLTEEAGIRVEPGDAEGFATAIRRLSRDRELRTNLGSRGRQLVEERYCRETLLEEMEADLLGEISQLNEGKN